MFIRSSHDGTMRVNAGGEILMVCLPRIYYSEFRSVGGSMATL